VCGITSRRGAEKLVLEGKVKVNGEKIDRPGTVIDEDRDVVEVNGVVARPISKKVYVLLNKPKNVLTALSDPFRRRTIANLINRLGNRVYPVGRLDYDTMGVLILTNDGELAYRLAHPKYEVERVYRALVAKTFSTDKIEFIENGIELADGHIGRGKVKIITTGIRNSTVELTLKEGHKREVKQLLKAVGHPVIELRRVEFAGLRAKGLRPGRWRYINTSEVNALKKLVGME
jgi:23S rRNA pseudouridine2605 synthase